MEYDGAKMVLFYIQTALLYWSEFSTKNSQIRRTPNGIKFLRYSDENCLKNEALYYPIAYCKACKLDHINQNKRENQCMYGQKMARKMEIFQPF